MSTPSEDPRFVAAINLIGRTGATSWQIRYSDDRAPIVWVTIAEYPGERFETASALNPLTALLRLCDQLVDGGQCLHCKRPTGFDSNFGSMPLSDLICWYQYDPGRKEFIRGCA